MSGVRAALTQWIRRRLLARWVVCRGARAGGEVALTFDDGPHPEVTPAVLDVLDRHGARATFFCVGEKLRKHAALAEEMRRRGHELGNHSMTHAELSRLDLEATRNEFDQVYAMVDVHDRPLIVQDFLRPPKGVINLKVLRYCSARNVRIVHWSRDPEDFARNSASEVLAQFRQRPLVGGDIVLLHDKMPHSAESLEGLLEHMREAGLRCVSVSQLLAASGP